MAVLRQYLHDNHWEMQCPVCRTFAPIDVDVMEGRAPFPRHFQWTPPWAYQFRDRMPRLFPYIEKLFYKKALVHFEIFVRRRWGLPCYYRGTRNWRAEIPSTGVSALGPLRA